jgi:uncharacterized membrane protein YbaN (DUF454 family)
MNPTPSDPLPSRVHGPRRAIYVALGFFFVGLAMVGIVLPVLPTTPFLLLAAWFFARSSHRFYDWLLENKRFGPLLRQWRADRSLPPGVKTKAIVVVVVAFTISILVVHLLMWLQGLLLLIGLALIVFLLRLPERELEHE